VIPIKLLKTPVWDLKEMLSLPLTKGKLKEEPVNLINQTPTRKVGLINQAPTQYKSSLYTR